MKATIVEIGAASNIVLGEKTPSVPDSVGGQPPQEEGSAIDND